MGIGCVLLLWTLLAGLAAVVVAIGAVVLVIGFRARATGRIVTGGLLAAGGGLVMLGAIAFVASWLISGGRPHYSTSPAEFEAQFGLAPGPDVSGIQIESSGSTDSVHRFIRFRSSRQTIDAIVARRFESVPFEQCELELRQVRERKPEWFRPERSATATCYVASPFDDSFASSEAWLAYEPVSQEAHFHYIGID